MSCLPLISAYVGPKRPDCAWCQLRIAAEVHQGTWSCRECIDGGRVFRLRMAAEKFKRGRKG